MVIRLFISVIQFLAHFLILIFVLFFLLFLFCAKFNSEIRLSSLKSKHDEFVAELTEKHLEQIHNGSYRFHSFISFRFRYSSSFFIFV